MKEGDSLNIEDTNTPINSYKWDILIFYGFNSPISFSRINNLTSTTNNDN